MSEENKGLQIVCFIGLMGITYSGIFGEIFGKQIEKYETNINIEQCYDSKMVQDKIIEFQNKYKDYPKATETGVFEDIDSTCTVYTQTKPFYNQTRE